MLAVERVGSTAAFAIPEVVAPLPITVHRFWYHFALYYIF